jgi:plasmid stabilization system protein ParE
VTLRFHPAAQDELIESALYYEAARAGLGAAFRDAVRAVLDRLLEFPEIGEPRHGTRRLMVAGFPYDIVYRVTTMDLEVLAVAHHRRRPGYWRRRV